MSTGCLRTRSATNVPMLARVGAPRSGTRMRCSWSRGRDTYTALRDSSAEIRLRVSSISPVKTRRACTSAPASRNGCATRSDATSETTGSGTGDGSGNSTSMKWMKMDENGRRRGHGHLTALSVADCGLWMAQRRTSSRREMSRGRGEAPAGVFRQVSSSSCRSRCLSKVGDGDIPGVDSVPHTGAGQDGDSEPDREWVHERDEAEARERAESGKPRRPRASKVGLVALGRLVSEPHERHADQPVYHEGGGATRPRRAPPRAQTG